MKPRPPTTKKEKKAAAEREPGSWGPFSKTQIRDSFKTLDAIIKQKTPQPYAETYPTGN